VGDGGKRGGREQEKEEETDKEKREIRVKTRSCRKKQRRWDGGTKRRACSPSLAAGLPLD
jgi:hypothetical protein